MHTCWKRSQRRMLNRKRFTTDHDHEQNLWNSISLQPQHQYAALRSLILLSMILLVGQKMKHCIRGATPPLKPRQTPKFLIVQARHMQPKSNSSTDARRPFRSSAVNMVIGLCQARRSSMALVVDKPAQDAIHLPNC